MRNDRSRIRIDWLAIGPLVPYVDAFKQYLTDRGYAKSVFGNCIHSIAHFAQWIREKRMRTCRIDEAVITEFFDDHLPRCMCIGAVHRDRRNLSAALGHLLVVLRAKNVIGQPKTGRRR